MSLQNFLSALVIVSILGSTRVPPLAGRSKGFKLFGVNLSGAEFGDAKPGVYDIDYIYPTQEEVDYFFAKGFNTFRIPFLWERLQHEQFGDFDPDELARLDQIVAYATGLGLNVILDPHNFARYYGELIGSKNVPNNAFADFWAKLAGHFKDNKKVIFGLMNEPHSMPTELWLEDANAAIQAIRATEAANLILVPGNEWSGAYSWFDSWYGTPNSEAMLNIEDPGNNYAYEVHQYLDSDSSGTSENCVSSTIGSKRISGFTDWLRKFNRRGFLGEFAGARNTVCYQALDDLLSYLDNNSDVWMGWSYWSAGPWWEDYMFTIEPKDGKDRPQMSILEKHLPPRAKIYLPLVQAPG